MIEINYKVNIEGYIEMIDDNSNMELFSQSLIEYKYTNKEGLISNTSVQLFIANKSNLLSNCVKKLANEISEAGICARIKFKDEKEYKNFIKPSWLSFFTYVE